MFIGEILVILLVASVPAVVIYYFFRLYQCSRNPEKALEHERRPLSKFKRVVFLTIGSLSVLVGVSVFAWVFYNLFVERQPQFDAPGIDSSSLFTMNFSAFRAFFMPGFFICLGLVWIGFGLKGKRDNA